MNFWVLLALVVVLLLFVVIVKNNSNKRIEDFRRRGGRVDDGAISSLNSRVASLEGTLKRIDSSLKDLTPSGDLDKIYQKLKAEISQAPDNSAIEQIAETVKATQNELAKVQASMGELDNSAVIANMNQIAETVKTTQNELAKVQASMGELDNSTVITNMNQIAETVKSTQNELAKVQASIGESDNSAVIANMNQIAAAMKSTQNELAKIQNAVIELKNENKILGDKLQTASTETDGESIKAIEERVTVIESNSQALLSKLQQYQGVLVQWQNNFNVIQTELNNYKETISKFYKILETQQKQLDAYKINRKEVRPAPSDIEEYQTGSGDSQKIPSTDDDIPSPPPEDKPSIPPVRLTIRDFNVKKTGKILFKNEIKQAIRQFRMAESLSYITAFLANAKYEKKGDFIDIVNNYKQSLNKIENKLIHGKFDENVISQELTEAFFAALSDKFLKTIMVAIYRGRNDNHEFYSKLLTKINEYLSACCVYTVLMEPKKVLDSAAIECMEIAKKDTDQKSEDKIIDEIERLPYYIDYLTEDGEIDKFCCEGKMLVYKFTGDTQ